MFMYVNDGLLDMYYVWINYVSLGVKKGICQDPSDTVRSLPLHKTPRIIQTLMKNELFPTTDARQRQHVEAVGGRTFFGGLVSTFVFDIFKIHCGRGRGIVPTGTTLATVLLTCNVFQLLGHCKSSEVWVPTRLTFCKPIKQW
jgi:hypothetical protein